MPKKTLLSFLLCCIWCSFDSVVHAATALSDCQTLESKPGVCVSIDDCPSMRNESQGYISLSQCGEGRTKVCCDVNHYVEENLVIEDSVSALETKAGTAAVSCVTPDDQPGRCLVLAKCAPLRDLLRQELYTLDIEKFLKRSMCGFDGISAKVCCPEKREAEEKTDLSHTLDDTQGPITSPLLPNISMCGPVLYNRIKGGTAAELDEFPWMALLEYSTPKGNRFSCGGALITNKYVLTAAHCINGSSLPADWVLSNVRLGEYDISADKDCTTVQGNTLCLDPPVDRAIAEIIIHEKYNPISIAQYHDIALLRLVEEVSYTDYIKPICLPTSEDLLNKTYVNSTSVVAGWGKTENGSGSDKLMKLKMPIKAKKECEFVYSHKFTVGAGQICAGGASEKDSCKGDSGGPLMVTETKTGYLNYHAVGIVSFGPSKCGLEGWPGIYTDITKYMRWIVSKLKP